MRGLYPLEAWAAPRFAAIKIVKLVYLDEAGISNPAQEPILVVAGVVIDPDRQWKDIETYFRDLARQLFPDEDPHRFVFHAKDIFHGSGPFDRSIWSRDERMKILRQLAQVPALFNLPIVVGAVNRKEAEKDLKEVLPNATAKGIAQQVHVVAFAEAIQRLQFWMEKNSPDEVAMLIAEDVAGVKDAIRMIHEGYTDPTDHDDGAFSARNVVDAVHFAKKDELLLLQVADHCAFIVKRALMGKSDIAPHYNLLAPRIQREMKLVRHFRLRVPTIDLVELPPDD